MSTLPDAVPIITDERLQFYLRHRRQLEQWAALGDEVRSEVNNVLRSLEGDMEALASQLGGDVRLVSVLGDSWPRFMFSRTHWDRHGPEAAATIAFEWVRSRVDPATGNAPYVGIRAPSEELRARIKAIIADSHAHLLKRYRKGAMWPVYRPLEPTAADDWWQDAAKWRFELLVATAEAWTELEPIVASAHS